MSGWAIAMMIVLGLVALAAAAIGLAFFRISRLPRREKKLLLKRHLRHAWRWMEERGLVWKNPAFIYDYHRFYPELEILEQNHAVIQKECRELLAYGDRLPHIKEAGGQYTERGIHEIDWKTFMLKSGGFIDENCRHAPETARLLRRIPRVETAFFSILGPGQDIRAHWGYYKGFLRYHLGVIVPHNNEDEGCWIRVNDDRVAYDNRDRSVIDEGETYYWHEGEGIVFDDTYLHAASNHSDGPRVVLFLDMVKPLPWYLHYPNRLFIWLARFDKSFREIRRGATMTRS